MRGRIPVAKQFKPSGERFERYEPGGLESEANSPPRGRLRSNSNRPVNGLKGMSRAALRAKRTVRPGAGCEAIQTVR